MIIYHHLGGKHLSQLLVSTPALRFGRHHQSLAQSRNSFGGTRNPGTQAETLFLECEGSPTNAISRS